MSKIVDKKECNYDNIKASTKTFIIKTNIIIDIKKLFDFLPITHYNIIPKKRGRKKKNTPIDIVNDLPNGSVITLEYEDKIRGVDLKDKKRIKKTNNDSSPLYTQNSSKKITYFRNSTAIVMMIDNKIINFKISNNGKFQMTGCKYMSHAEKCIHYIWSYIKHTDIYKFYNLKESELEVMFIPSMRNIDFDIGFTIDREALDNYINTNTEFRSLLETSIGYTGVNIKMPFSKSILDIKVVQKKWENGIWINKEIVSYSNYLDKENEKERKKKINKKRFTTFLVFHSGKTIMSTISKSYGKEPFYKFLDIIINNKNILEEKLNNFSEI